MVLGNIAMYHYPVTTLGPGSRVGIWFQGCNKNCKGCESPNFRKIVKPVDCGGIIDDIMQIFSENDVEGLTISGGEPFLQAEMLLFIIEQFRRIQASKGRQSDILIYSGFTYEQLIESDVNKNILEKVSVLIDGPYVEQLNDGKGIRGSRNQRLIILDDSVRFKYEQVSGKRNASVVWNDFLGKFVYIGLSIS